jgi:hypothetical protein
MVWWRGRVLSYAPLEDRHGREELAVSRGNRTRRKKIKKKRKRKREKREKKEEKKRREKRREKEEKRRRYERPLPAEEHGDVDNG